LATRAWKTAVSIAVAALVGGLVIAGATGAFGDDTLWSIVEDEQGTTLDTAKATGTTTSSTSTSTTTTSTSTTTTTTTTTAPPPPPPPSTTPPPPPPPAPPPPSPSTSVSTAEVVALINAERAARQLAPLQVHATLVGCAQSWSEHMAAIQSMVHSNLSCAMGATGSAGENLFYGFPAPSARAVVSMWLNSTTGHRETMLNPGYRFIGVGAAASPDGRVWVTANFG
jgi:uncharacterized protein YkwD